MARRWLLPPALALALLALAAVCVEAGEVVEVPFQVDPFTTATRELSESALDGVSVNTTCADDILGGCHTLILRNTAGSCALGAIIADGEMRCEAAVGCSGQCVLQLDGDDTEEEVALTLGADLLALGDILRFSVRSDVDTNVTVSIFDQDNDISVAVAIVPGNNETEQFDFPLLSGFDGNANMELVATIEMIVPLTSGIDVEITNVVIIDEQLPGIEGTVFVDCNCDAVVDVGEAPLPGIPVHLSGCSTSISTTSSSTGFYRFANLPPCTYTVSVEPLDVDGLCSSSPEIRVIEHGAEDVDEVNFGSRSFDGCTPLPATVQGFVRKDERCDGLDAGRFNLGAPGVVVTLEGVGNCSVSSLTNTTDVDGFYSFENLPACTYTVSVDDSENAVCPLTASSYEREVHAGAVVPVDFALRTPIPLALDDFENAIRRNGTSLKLQGALASASQQECNSTYEGVFGGCHTLSAEGIALGCTPEAGIRDGSLFVTSDTASCEIGFDLELGGSEHDLIDSNFDSQGTAFRVILEALNERTLFEVYVLQADGEWFTAAFNATDAPAEYVLPFASFANVNESSDAARSFADVQSVRLSMPAKADVDVEVAFFGIISTRGNIVGTVFVDCTCDGVPGEFDVELAGVQVALSGCMVSRTTQSNSQGLFAFLNLPPCSSYEVKADSVALAPLCSPTDAVKFVTVTDNSVDVYFGGGDGASGIECPVRPGALQGRVLFEEGCQALDVRPVSGVKVQIKGTGVGLDGAAASDECATYARNTTTNVNGQYSFENVPGECVVEVSTFGVEETLCPNKDAVLSVYVAEDAVVTDIDFGVREPLQVATVVDDFLAELVLQLEHVRGDVVASTTCDEFSGGVAGAIIGGCHTGVLSGVAAQACYPSITVRDGVATCSNGDVCSAECVLSLDGQDMASTAGLGLNGFNLGGAGTGFRVEVRADADTLFGYRVHDSSGLVKRMQTDVKRTNGEWVTYDLFFKDGQGVADVNSVGTIDLFAQRQRDLDISFRNWELIVPAADIIGTVFGDCNCDSELEEGEDRLAGVEVLMRGCGLERTTVTDDQGRYFFVNLLPCTYEVEVVSVQSIAGFCDDLVQDVVVFGEQVTHDIGVTCLGSITGFAYSDRDCRAVRDAGSGLEGVQISAVGVDPECPGRRTVSTLADGSYNVAGLVPCTYEVTVPADSEALCPDQPKTQLVVVESGQVEDEVDFRFSARANIIGNVFASGVCDTSQEAIGLPGVTVNIRGVSRCPINRNVQSNANGAYSIGRLAPCTYTVSVVTDGGVVCPLAETSFEIVLLPGVTRTQVDFLFIEHSNSFGSISGSVFQDNMCDNDINATSADLPLIGVPVSLFGEDFCPEQLLQTTTASDGTYAFAGIPPCTYTLTVPPTTGTPCPGEALLRRVQIAPAESLTNVDFRLSSRDTSTTTGGISGRVLGDVGCDGLLGAFDRPLVNIPVRVVSGPDCVMPLNDLTRTNDAGNYEFQELEACTYFVSVSESDTGFLCPQSPAERTVVVQRGQTQSSENFNIALIVELCDNVDCNDGDECTIDTCDPRTGECSNTPVENCGRPDVCAGGVCEAAYQCTEGVCDADSGYCEQPFKADCGVHKTALRLDDVTIACNRETATYHYSLRVYDGPVPEFFQLCVQPSTFVSATPLIDTTTGEEFCVVDEGVLTSRSTGLRGLKWDDCQSDVNNRTLRFDVTVDGFYNIDLGLKQSVFVSKKTSDRANFEYLLVPGPYDCDCAGSAAADIAGTDGTCVDYFNGDKCAESTLLEIRIPDKDTRRRAAVDEAFLEDLFASVLGIPRTDLQIEASYFRVRELVILVRLFDSSTRKSTELAIDLTVAVSSNDPVFIGTVIQDGVVNIVDLPDVVEGEFTISSAALTAPVTTLSLFCCIILLALSIL